MHETFLLQKNKKLRGQDLYFSPVRVLELRGSGSHRDRVEPHKLGFAVVFPCPARGKLDRIRVVTFVFAVLWQFISFLSPQEAAKSVY